MLSAKLIDWLLYAALGLAVLFVVFSTWDSLTSWLPWSDESRRERAVAEAAQAQAQAQTAQTQTEVNDAIDQRESETVTLQPIIIRQTEQAASKAQSAPSERAAADAFFDGVCQRSFYRDEPGCAEKDNSGNR